MISKYSRFLTNYQNFPRFFTEKRRRRQPPTPNARMTFPVNKICDASLSIVNYRVYISRLNESFERNSYLSTTSSGNLFYANAPR